MARKKTTEKEDRMPVSAKPPTRARDGAGTFRLNEDDMAVMDYLRKRTGIQSLTCIEEALGYTHQSCSARVHELGEQCGALRRAGVRRQTRSRRMAEVYVLADGLTAESALERYTAWCAASRGATTARRSHRERAVIKAAREYARLYSCMDATESIALSNLINAAKALEES